MDSKNFSRFASVTAATALLVTGGATSAQAAFFMGLGDLPGGDFASIPRAVSGNGSVVVGHSDSSNNQSEAFRWTMEQGIIGLGHIPGGGERSGAFGVSADGSIIVGFSDNNVGHTEAFRWTASEGMIGLGTLGKNPSKANAISANGSVIVGESRNEDGKPGVASFRDDL